MSIAGFLRTWGVVDRAYDEPQAKAYGVDRQASTDRCIVVRAPSGEEALRLAGTDGMTAEGEAYVICNHQGGGVYEIVIESW